MVDALGLPTGDVARVANVYDSLHPFDVWLYAKLFQSCEKMFTDGGFKKQKRIDDIRQKPGAESAVVLCHDMFSRCSTSCCTS